MCKIWTNYLLRKPLKSCPKSNISPNLVTLPLINRWAERQQKKEQFFSFTYVPTLGRFCRNGVGRFCRNGVGRYKSMQVHWIGWSNSKIDTICTCDSMKWVMLHPYFVVYAVHHSTKCSDALMRYLLSEVQLNLKQNVKETILGINSAFVIGRTHQHILRRMQKE